MSGGPHLFRSDQRATDDGERELQDLALRIHRPR